MIKERIKIPLYYQVLNVVVCNKFTKVMKKLSIEEDPKFEIDQHEAFVTSYKDEIYVFIRSKTPIGIIAHEAVHIANEVFKQADIALDINNDEPYAYLLGWIVEEIYKVQKK